MSLKALVWSIAQEDLTPTEKLTLIILADRHNVDSNECWPSKARIAKDTGLSETAVKKAINSLIDKGLITKEERAHPNGKSATNIYRFIFPKEQGEETPARLSGGRQTPPSLGVRRPLVRAPDDPLEPVSINRSIEPNKPSDKRKEFWDTALGVMGALNVPESTAKGILGITLNKSFNDYDAVLQVLDSALMNPPKNIAAYLVGSFKKKKTVQKEALSPERERAEQEYREKYKEYFDDTGKYIGEDHSSIQPQPHAEPRDLPRTPFKGSSTIPAAGSEEISGSNWGYLDSLQVSADNSGNSRSGG